MEHHNMTEEQRTACKVAKVKTDTKALSNNIAAWSGVIISFVAGLGYMTVSPLKETLTEINERLKTMDRNVFLHLKDGHPDRIQAQIDVSTVELEKLSDRLNTTLDEIHRLQIRYHTLMTDKNMQ